MSCDQPARPKITVIILTYNSLDWLPHCFASLERQTILNETEIIVVDNASTDGCDEFARKWAVGRERVRVVRNSTNLYFCGGNNVGAAVATGEFLLFLNPDLWLEPDCLGKLYRGVIEASADAATPLVLEYDDDTFQSCGSPGFDVFGLAVSFGAPPATTTEELVACGCSLLVRAEMFKRIGGFPEEFLMYAEETDVCWRVWIAGGTVVTVPDSKLHHRGAALANPAGHTKTIEARTSDTKRFLSNRNSLLVLLKNSQHLLLLLLIPHLFLLLIEAIVSLLLVRRWSYIRKSYFGAMADASRMIKTVRVERRKIRSFRKRSDFQMLRFLRLRPARWDEVKRLFKFGVPKVDAR